MNVIKKYGLMWWAVGATLLAIIFINAYIFGVAMRNLSNEPYLYAKLYQYAIRREYNYGSLQYVYTYEYYSLHAYKMLDPKTIDYDENGNKKPIVFTVRPDLNPQEFEALKENTGVFRVVMYKESNYTDIKFWEEQA